MSALLSKFTPLRVANIFLLAICAAILIPQTASANTLPTGTLERQTCGAFVVDVKGYGAGMMHTLDPIGIANRRLSYIDPVHNCAVVQWSSSIPAATQVLFAELGDEPVTINTSIDPNFGYPHATTQNNAGLASHTAILEGLKPGVAYSYRLVTRAHPSAIPHISDAHVLIAGPVTPPVVPPVITPTPIPTPPPVKFDAEKFPVTPTPSTINTPTISEKDDEKEDDTATSVPAAVNAADQALGGISQEGALWERIKAFVAGLVPSAERFSLSSNIGLFEKDRFIVPTLFFLLLLFLLQQFVLPAFGVAMQQPVLYWLLGAVVLSLVSAFFMLYYITLIGIALFLGLLAWYLLQSIPEEESATKALAPLSKDDSKDKEKPKNSKPLKKSS